VGRSTSLDDLRRYAVARTLFAPTTLARAITRLGFVQADPIRQPARAQDLILRHRVTGYRAGDLEAKYPRLAIEEDFFVNYGFVPRELHVLMHPRTARRVWTRATSNKAHAVLDFVRERGVVHPREVDAHFQHGRTTNWFGGTSNASTQLLDGMHYRGLLRVARREGGTRCYAAREPHADAVDAQVAMDRLIDVAVAVYAPVPARTLGQLVAWVARAAVPQWQTQRREALARAKARLAQASVDGTRWYWPPGENPLSKRHAPDDAAVKLLAPFDPIVWDRARFEAFWGWAYRFEAYTPQAKRQRGYYAMPLLRGDRVIGWGNLVVKGSALDAAFGWVAGRAPRDARFAHALDAELERMRTFLRVG
jgi:uncharacterized protein